MSVASKPSKVLLAQDHMALCVAVLLVAVWDDSQSPVVPGRALVCRSGGVHARGESKTAADWHVSAVFVCACMCVHARVLQRHFCSHRHQDHQRDGCKAVQVNRLPRSCCCAARRTCASAQRCATRTARPWHRRACASRASLPSAWTLKRCEGTLEEGACTQGAWADADRGLAGLWLTVQACRRNDMLRIGTRGMDMRRHGQTEVGERVWGAKG